MPTFRGLKTDNSRIIESLGVGRWKSLTLQNTAVDDRGMEILSTATALEQVAIVKSRITDRSIAILCQLPRLRSLIVESAPGVTDESGRYLGQAVHLRELYLNETSITDRCIRQLRGLTNIWSFCFRKTKVSDAGAKVICELPKIRILGADETQITGAGLSAAGLSGPIDLRLRACPVDDASIRHFLGPDRHIDTLSLSQTSVTNASLESIAAIRSLVELRLQNCRVDDEGARELLGHPSLGRLYLGGTGVSEAFRKTLEARSPRELLVYDTLP